MAFDPDDKFLPIILPIPRSERPIGRMLVPVIDFEELKAAIHLATIGSSRDQTRVLVKDLRLMGDRNDRTKKEEICYAFSIILRDSSDEFNEIEQYWNSVVGSPHPPETRMLHYDARTLNIDNLELLAVLTKYEKFLSAYLARMRRIIYVSDLYTMQNYNNFNTAWTSIINYFERKFP